MSSGARSALSDRRPLLMGILNGSPESFSAERSAASDEGDILTLLADGADVLDIGGQSLRTDQEEIPVAEERARVNRLLELVDAHAPAGVRVSIDTYRSGVVDGLVTDRVVIINDPSVGVDPLLPRLCAERGLYLVMTYNVAPPKVRLSSSAYVADPVRDCVDRLSKRIDDFLAIGGTLSQVILDPGVDLGKSPAQSVEVLRSVPEIRAALGVERVLWALSRKDFIGSILRVPPQERDFGTLGAIAGVELEDGDLLRVHNVRAVRHFLDVREALRGSGSTIGELDPSLRHGR